MGTNTLTPASAGTIPIADVNDIQDALKEDFVPRNSSGVATNEAGSLGTPSIQWFQIRAKKIFIDGEEVGTTSSLQPNDLVSGRTRTTSEQAAFIVPAGAGNGNSLTVDGTPVNLIYDVDGSLITLSNDLSVTSLTVAPSTNNTALVNDADAADQDSTRTWGEELAEKTTITIDAAGTEITGRIGTFQSFKINDGTNDEFFLAFITSATSLKFCRRGHYYDESDNPVNRIRFANNDTITLMNTAWIFLENDAATAEFTINNPVWSDTEPTGPATNDRWFDFTTFQWKKFDGAVFNVSNQTWIGMGIIDDTDCVVARSVQFSKAYTRENTLQLENDSVTVIKGINPYSRTNVFGVDIKFNLTLPSWDIATDLATSADLYDATEQASRRYYMYLSQDGETKISDIEPYYQPEIFGFYHPHNTWRAVGYAFNDAGSNFTFVSWFGGSQDDQELDFFETFNDSTTFTATTFGVFVTATLSTTNQDVGSSMSRSTNVLSFRKRGRYRFVVKTTFRNITGISATSVSLRIRNTTDGTTLQNLPEGVAGSLTDPRHDYTAEGMFEILETDDQYEYQVETTGNDIQFENFYTLHERVKRPHV